MAKRVLSSIRQWQRDMLPLGNDLRALERWANEFDNRIGTIESATGIRTPTVSGSTLDTEFVAGNGMTGGGFLSYGLLTFNVGAGNGITVNADTIEVDPTIVPTKSGSMSTNTFARWTGANTLSDSTLYYDPTSDGGLGRVGIRTLAPAAILHVVGTSGNQLRLGHDSSNYADITLSSAGAVTLNATGASASWIFSDETVHNAGVDVGTSGRFDSNVADAVGADSFLFKPSVALTSGVDRNVFAVEDSAAYAYIEARPDGSLQLTRGTGSTTSGGLVNVQSSTSFNLGIKFQITGSGTGSNILGWTAGVSGANFTVLPSATPGASNYIGGAFEGGSLPTLSANIASMWGGGFRAFSNSGGNSTRTFTESGGWKVWPISLASTAKNMGTITNYYGGYVSNSLSAAAGASSAVTNAYGLYLEEQTRAATINNEVFIAGAGGVWFRDQELHIDSATDGHLDLYADTSIDMNGDVDMSTVDLITDTTTGTKIATGNTQKLGFWSATPIVQPTTAVAAATFTANTSGIVDDSATFDGYTIGQVVKALRNTGLLA